MKKYFFGAALCWLLSVATVATAGGISPSSISPSRAPAKTALPRGLATERLPWTANLPTVPTLPRPLPQGATNGRKEVQVLTGSGYAGLFPIQSIGNRMGSSITRSGTTVAVGAIGDGTYTDPSDPYNTVPPMFLGNGSVYIFEKDGGVWKPVQKLAADDGAAGDYFGYTVAMSGDTLLVGSVYATVNGNYGQGAVYVFKRTERIWSQTQKLTADDGLLFSEFGWSIAVQGGTALIGAPLGLNGDTLEPGAAYVFTESNGVWSQNQKLTASDGVSNDQFGLSVGLDGSSALIGAPITQNGVGSVYAFSAAGGSWTETQRVTGCYRPGEQVNFGYSMAMQGTTALVGASGGGSDADPSPGAACLLSQTNGNWSITQTLTPSDGAAYDTFGVTVTLQDGVAAVAAPLVNWGNDANTSKGAVYLFKESNGNWTQVDELARNQPPQAGDGYSVDSLGDGGMAIDGTAVLVTVSIANTFGTGNVDVFDFPAQPSAAPSSLAFSVAAGASASHAINLANGGTQPLSFDVVDGSVLSQISSDVPSDDVPNVCFLIYTDDPTRIIGTSGNAWYRRFYFNEHPQVGASASIDAVTVGIQSAAVGTPVAINLYSISHEEAPIDTLDVAQLTPIGASTFIATGHPMLGLSVPVEGTIDDTATQDLVVEYRVDETVATPVFVPALNSNPQTHNALYDNIGCGGGFGTASTAGRWSHILISPHLDAAASGIECANPTTTPWLSVSPGDGAVGSGASQAISVNVDATGLAPGHYSTQLCLEAKSPLPSMIQVPVDLTVTEPDNDSIFKDGFDDSNR